MKLSEIFNRGKYKPQQPITSRRLYNLSGGEFIGPENCMEVSAFYSGVIYISTQIAKLPWIIKDDKNQIVTNRVSKLLKLRPNPEMNSMTFRLLAVQEAIIKGNFYAEIERDMLGRPVAIWPLSNNHVSLERMPDDSLAYRIMGAGINGKDVFLQPSDVFHVKNFYSRDGLVGQGLVSYASEVLGINKGADRMANSLFSNGGLPSVALEMEGTLDDAGFEKVKESWTQMHGGRKAGGVTILEDGLKVKPLNFQPDVMQFLESRKFSVIEIARFLRLPPTKLYDTETSSYNNIEHANLEVAVDTLDAWARNFEMEADSKLLNDGFGGKSSEMDLYAIFRGDMETRSKYFNTMMQNAAMTPNEMRQKEGMTPYEDGDKFYIAANNFKPVDRLDELIDAELKSKEPKVVEKQVNESEDKLNEEVANYFAAKLVKN